MTMYKDILGLFHEGEMSGVFINPKVSRSLT